MLGQTSLVFFEGGGCLARPWGEAVVVRRCHLELVAEAIGKMAPDGLYAGLLPISN
jgi:hypothetical protein